MEYPIGFDMPDTMPRTWLMPGVYLTQMQVGRDDTVLDTLRNMDTPAQAAQVAAILGVGEHIPEWLVELAVHAAVYRMAHGLNASAVIDRFAPEFEAHG